MYNRPVPEEPEKIDRETCRKDISPSAAVTEEGEDYVMHFCGLDCYRAWKERNGN
jgi:hypothetical protein